MFSSFIQRLITEPTNDAQASRRRYPRRPTDNCVCMINGIPHPVKNWSLGGVLIHADGRLFAQTQETDLTMKFKVGHGVVDITHRGTIIRKSDDMVAFEFAPLTKQTKQKFHNVINSLVVGEFADSQMV